MTPPSLQDPQGPGLLASLWAARALPLVHAILHPVAAAVLPTRGRFCSSTRPCRPAHTLAQGLEKMTVSSGVHILPRNGAVSPFSSTWGNAHQPLHRGTPLRSALVSLLWTLLGTGFCLWRGVWKEVEGESFFRPSLVGPKDHCQLFVFQTLQFFWQLRAGSGNSQGVFC